MRAEALVSNKSKKARPPKSALKIKQPIASYQIDATAAYRDQFLCGDSLEVMRQIPSSSIDLAVTSPPYNLKIRLAMCCRRTNSSNVLRAGKSTTYELDITMAQNFASIET